MTSTYGSNPVLELMQKADKLAEVFDNTHQRTSSIVQELLVILASPTNTDRDPIERVEQQLSYLRIALEHMEKCVTEMMSMLYQVDIFLEQPQTQGISSKDPRAALEHVSDLFHMYQSELLEKREALSDLTCEEISPTDFAQRWNNLDQVKSGRRQTMDDLADLLAGLG